MSKMKKKKIRKMTKMEKNRASFLPSPVPPLNKGTLNLPKITEHSAEQGMFGLSLNIVSEKQCPICDFLTQQHGWMYLKENFDDVHPRAGLTKVDEESAKCQLLCGFKINPIMFDGGFFL